MASPRRVPASTAAAGGGSGETSPPSPFARVPPAQERLLLQTNTSPFRDAVHIWFGYLVRRFVSVVQFE